MTTKIKGLLKGLRYISQIFDEEKEAEIQIGLPTDVKHVAHIGFEGGQAIDNPSWMKEFKGEAGAQSAPLGPKDNSQIKWDSEDSNRRSSRTNGNNPDKDPELPKSSRRQSSSSDNISNPDSPKSKNKPSSRRNRSKETADGAAVKSRDAGDLSDVPKKSRRKKSKDCDNGSNRSTRSSRRRQAGSGMQDAGGQDPEFFSELGDSSTGSSKRGGST